MKSAYSFFIALTWSFFLAGCGGGGSVASTPDNGGTTPTPVTVSIQLSTDNELISVDNAANITATVVDSNGSPVRTVVTFSLDDASYGSFDPATGKVSTDLNGKAVVKLNTASVPTAATVTATTSSGETISIPVTMIGDGGASTGGPTVSLVLTDEHGTPIKAISSLLPGRLIATVNGLSKETIVTFSTDRGEIPIDTAVTDKGTAYVQILAGASPGAVKATVTLLSGETDEIYFNIGATNVFMGSGNPFKIGTASITPTVVSAGGTASISVTLKDDQGNLFTEPAEVKFSTTCSAKSTPEAELSSPVIAVNGVATSTYLSKGCVGDDTINISANVGGKALTATGTLNVLSASVGSIFFVEAIPENIRLKGTGGVESSTVKFRVLDKNGHPVKNQLVNFYLNTSIGQVELDPESAVTNAEGFAQSVVNSGSVSTSVRVTAVVDGSSPAITSQSNLLVISTGLPDQDSFSLSVDNATPEGWDYDGVEVNVTARLADAFNNPVPDGTAVSFTTEGGVIEPSCLTTSGVCSVKWTSQNPRPWGGILAGAPTLTKMPKQPYGGRVTILATAIGEESFFDTNGNGRFDNAEFNQFLTEKDTSGNEYDLAEAFVDHNEDTVFNPEMVGEDGGDKETFVDFNNSKSFDIADGLYNGSLCKLDDDGNSHAGCSTTHKSINVRASSVLIMSGSKAWSSAPDISDSCVDDKTIVDACDGLNDNSELDIIGKGTGGVSIIVGDLHNQPLPSGTKIKFTPSAGSLASKGEITVASSIHNGSKLYSVTIKGSDTPESGLLLIEAITPKGKVTQIAEIKLTIH